MSADLRDKARGLATRCDRGRHDNPPMPALACPECNPGGSPERLLRLAMATALEWAAERCNPRGEHHRHDLVTEFTAEAARLRGDA